MTIKTTNGAVNGKNGAWTCHCCKSVNVIVDRYTFSQEVTCACGKNFDLQQWDKFPSTALVISDILNDLWRAA